MQTVQEIKQLTACKKKFITVHESFFSQVKDYNSPYTLFTPVRKIFMKGKLSQLKSLSDENTLIAVNQIVMGSDLNKSSLSKNNLQFKKQCENMNVEY